MSTFTSVKRVGPVIVITRVTDNIEEFKQKLLRHVNASKRVIEGVEQQTRRETQL